MLMEWLRQRDCVKTGLELFINHHHINDQTRRGLRRAAAGAVGEAADTFSTSPRTSER